ncbi:MAG: gliding motility-associated C-terminal domain-containing protein [Bacteroidetes bacterium]|nr:gliding motility-associated C-terminal domain-containing protein [Bacteroidota bacterium]
MKRKKRGFIKQLLLKFKFVYLHNHQTKTLHSRIFKSIQIILIFTATNISKAQNIPLPVACYNFSGNLNEFSGGTSLTPLSNPGTYSNGISLCQTDTFYNWVIGNGLKLSIGTLFSKDDYTIELLFKFTTSPYPKNWQRILDFKSNTSDVGLYLYQNNLQFYTQYTGTSNMALPNKWFRLFLTRDANTDSVKGYINNNLEIAFRDVSGAAKFNTDLILFKDDNVVVDEESAGTIDYMRIYNKPLTKAQILKITVDSIPIASVNGNFSICKGQSTVLTASGGLNYSWSTGASVNAITVSPATTTTYSVWADLFCTYSHSCQHSPTTVTVTVTNCASPTITISKTDITCYGDNNGTASVNPSGGVFPYTYSWSTGAVAQTINGLSTGTYTVTVTDAAGSKLISTLAIISPALLTIMATSTNSECGRNNGTASAFASGGNKSYTYDWEYINQKISGQTISNLSAGSYTITVSDQNGCSTVTSVNVTDTLLVSTNGTPARQTIIEGNSVAFSLQGADTYSWSPSTGLSCTNCATPIATPSSTTTYTVVAKDYYGCSTFVIFTIIVNPPCVGDDSEVFIPNVFSPNNDGQNDILYIEGNGLSNIYWAIYDRWGNTIFEGFDQSHGWDGTWKGNQMGTGTYVYYLKAICTKTNNEIKLKGSVNVMK